MRVVFKAIIQKLPIIRGFDEHMVEVASGASVAFVTKVLGAGLSFGFNILLARILGAEGAGLYFVAIIVANIGVTIGIFGLDNTLLRLIADYSAKGQWGIVKGVYCKGIWLSLGVSFLVASLIFLTAPLLAQSLFHKPELATPLRLMSLTILPKAVMILHGQAIKALKRIRDSQLINGVTVPALSMVGLILIGSTLGVTGAVWANCGAAVIAAVLGVLMWHRHTPELKKLITEVPFQQVLNISVPLFWVAIANLVIEGSSTFFLGIWGSKEEIGVFGIAWRTATLTSFILLSVNSIVAPKFAALYGQGDMVMLSSTARKSTAMMVLLASPLLLIFLIAPVWVMRIFGEQFLDGSPLLSILAVGQFINVTTGSVGYLLMMSGRERLMLINTLTVAVLCLTLNALLIPRWGALGAAVANATSLAALNLGAFYLVWRGLGIWTLPVLKPNARL